MRVYGATTNPDEWDAFIARLPEAQRDVHFTSAYGRVQEAANIGRAILAVHEFEAGGFVAQPFLMQRIEGTEFFDLKNLYGFGGPVSNIRDLPGLRVYGEAFRELLKMWARENDVVSEFCVLHPLFSQYMLPLVITDSILFSKQVVVIEGLSSFTAAKCSRRVQRALKKAERFDVIEVEDLYAFDKLYTSSMDRLGAAKRWRYDVKYWLAHKHEDVGARWYFVPGHRGLLVIGKGRTAYAHFLGSDGECLRDGLDELLYFHTSVDLEGSFDRLHLGGGLSERNDDSLLAFKSGFSKTRYNVGSYSRVFMPSVYEDLTLERAQGQGINWFPAYRGGEVCRSLTETEVQTSN